MSAIRQTITEGKRITVPNDAGKAALQSVQHNNYRNIHLSSSLPDNGSGRG